jgi:uncharacterized membrane protein YcaP (DUF421 family)
MDELTINVFAALRVVIATIVMYLVFVSLVRLLGPRSLATTSISDLACVLALGAVIGRTALLSVPTLGSGVVALVTLFVVQRAARVARRSQRMTVLLDRPAVLLAADGRCDVGAMRRAGVTEDELRQLLRLAGIGSWEQIGRVVLERTGEISVVQRDAALDDALFSDVAADSEVSSRRVSRGRRRPWSR